VSAAGYCSHYLLPESITPVANLPPVSMTPAANFLPFATGVVDTGGKFAAGVIDTGGKFAPVRISPRIFEKFEMILMLLSGAWGKGIHEKNLKQKIS
jgi:hypothetical protein